ncbi:MAG TPA: hypothetical protein PK970_05760 [Hyphomicrobiaceae bacterium]|nr:hypothetical protein [Hyphomicrobiaceae bacterium]
MAHLFKVGQLVDFTPDRSRMASSSQKYEIIRCLPPDTSGVNQYRIKSKAEMFERIAREGELKRRV